ncbi:hypothetical protein COOONC_05066 [Cooperia oncophora]
MLLPARKRSLFFKIFILVPVVWICVVFYFAVVDHASTIHDNKAEAAKRMPRVPLVQGFGPPISNEKNEEAKPAPKDKDIGEEEDKKLSPEEKKKYDLGFQNNAFNQYASDMISIHRTLPEILDKDFI